MNEIINHVTMKENTAHLIKLHEALSKKESNSGKILLAVYVAIGTQLLVCGELLWLIAKH
jgi:hypothetical protein